jgi:hypothetical protein
MKARPDRNQPAVARAAAIKLLKVLAENDYDIDPDCETTISTVSDQLYHARNGYDLARRLEDKWIFDRSDIDVCMVDLLDNDYLSDAVDEATKVWVKENGIVPLFEYEDKVVTIDDAKTKGMVGVVVNVNRIAAKYTVRFEQLGHVKEGSKYGGTIGYNFPYEKVAAAPATSQENQEDKEKQQCQCTSSVKDSDSGPAETAV